MEIFDVCKIQKIFASGGASLNCALLVVTNILWVSAVLLPSWFVFSIGTDKSVYTAGETHVGLFYVFYCGERRCSQSFTKNGSRIYDSVIPDVLELQIESISMLLLCALSCVILLIPMKSTPKSTSTRFLTVCVILPVACILDIILIIRATLAYKEVSSSFKEWETQFKFSLLKVEMKFPSSILLSGIGAVFAIMSWVLSIVLYRISRRSHVQNMGDGIFMSNKRTSVNP
ncbi:uncharacterized protein [Magallana gigas]|uniref:uncharacterized protein isoform X1 n=1 Tax=Magallana gigas TaxID=29159 RepID=UPI00333FEFBD